MNTSTVARKKKDLKSNGKLAGTHFGAVPA